KGRIHRVLPVDRKIRILQSLGGRIPRRLKARGNRLVPLRGGGSDKELMVEERSSVGRMEEVVVHRVLLGNQALRKVRGVEVAQVQALVIVPGYAFVVVAGPCL